ncbi:hypothetical protein TUBRATIS_23940 [Tubulinosema ratisbonensis]|uniref:Uncharacterized protein n=1 Tax=Tubulinosema ratisbonensis TaxID=291195 RepID=A0A437AJF8_9MICR|nr:hypothetical protein TUBRATIS_23940 [Tubulinosema ratisbonensis]
MKILEYFVERMFSSKEFKVLSSFIVPLKLIENSFVAINKISTSLKTYHKLIGQIILQFKCIEFVLFGGELFFLTKKYIPRYKIEILKKLRFKILFYVWDTMNHNSSLFLEETRDYFLLLCFENFLKIYNEDLIERYFSEDDLSLEYLNFKKMASKYNVLILWLKNKII